MMAGEDQSAVIAALLQEAVARPRRSGVEGPEAYRLNYWSLCLRNIALNNVVMTVLWAQSALKNWRLTLRLLIVSVVEFELVGVQAVTQALNRRIKPAHDALFGLEIK